jgi:hypothetical protein
MADPGSAFPAGDPRNAFYAENLAALEHQRGREKAGSEEGLSQARSKATYRQGLLGQAEPGTYKVNQERANSGGVLESGINAKRRGGIAADYANKRYQVTQGLKEYEEGSQRREKGSQERYTEGRAKAGTQAEVQGREYLERNPPTDYSGSYPGLPPGAKVTGSAGPGGVVPYEQNTPGGGFVKVGQPLKKQRPGRGL